MKTIKKLSGSFLLGLAVIGLALSARAFTENSGQAAKQTAGEIYVNTSTSGDYEKLPSPGDYLDSNCEDLGEHTCSWQRTEVPGSVPDNFNASQADSLEQAGLITPNSMSKGTYVNP